MIDFTDHGYQSQLPDHQRSTAVQSIRSNLKATELQLCDSITTKRQLVRKLLQSFLASSLTTACLSPRCLGVGKLIRALLMSLVWFCTDVVDTAAEVAERFQEWEGTLSC